MFVDLFRLKLNTHACLRLAMLASCTFVRLIRHLRLPLSVQLCCTSQSCTSGNTTECHVILFVSTLHIRLRKCSPIQVQREYTDDSLISQNARCPSTCPCALIRFWALLANVGPVSLNLTRAATSFMRIMRPTQRPHKGHTEATQGPHKGRTRAAGKT